MAIKINFLKREIQFFRYDVNVVDNTIVKLLIKRLYSLKKITIKDILNCEENKIKIPDKSNIFCYTNLNYLFFIFFI